MYTGTTLLLLLFWCLCGDVYTVMYVCVDCLCNVTVVISVYWYHSAAFTVLVSVC